MLNVVFPLTSRMSLNDTAHRPPPKFKSEIASRSALGAKCMERIVIANVE